MPSPDTFWEKFPEHRALVHEWGKDRLPVKQIASIHSVILLAIVLLMAIASARPQVLSTLTGQDLSFYLKILALAAVAEWAFVKLVMKSKIALGFGAIFVAVVVAAIVP